MIGLIVRRVSAAAKRYRNFLQYARPTTRHLIKPNPREAGRCQLSA